MAKGQGERPIHSETIIRTSLTRSSMVWILKQRCCGFDHTRELLGHTRSVGKPALEQTQQPILELLLVRGV